MRGLRSPPTATPALRVLFLPAGKALRADPVYVPSSIGSAARRAGAGVAGPGLRPGTAGPRGYGPPGALATERGTAGRAPGPGPRALWQGPCRRRGIELMASRLCERAAPPPARWDPHPKYRKAEHPRNNTAFGTVGRGRPFWMSCTTMTPAGAISRYCKRVRPAALCRREGLLLLRCRRCRRRLAVSLWSMERQAGDVAARTFPSLGAGTGRSVAQWRLLLQECGFDSEGEADESGELRLPMFC